MAGERDDDTGSNLNADTELDADGDNELDDARSSSETLPSDVEDAGVDDFDEADLGDANLEDADLEETDLEHEEGVSLEELSQTYAGLLQTESADASARSSEGESQESSDGQAALGIYDPEPEEEPSDESAEENLCPATPLSILEAVLFVGRPDSGAITAAEIAGLMRGVDEREVEELVEQLNLSYEESNRALRVADTGTGYRIELASDLRFVADRFYGQVRDVKLNQAAIDCLALVAYQPGISRETLEKQRNQPSGGVLNQLVRRQLLEMRREGDPKKPTPHYYPTERLLQLTGLESLEDLPQVEDLS